MTAEERRARERARSHRKREVRAVVLPRISKSELARGRALFPVVDDEGRPRTRGDCAGGERPCPWVSCAHNLYLDVTDVGGVKVNFPDLEPDEMTESCALDVADRGGATLEEAGALLNMTRERFRQIEVKAIEKLGRRARAMGLTEALAADDPVRHDAPVEADGADGGGVGRDFDPDRIMTLAGASSPWGPGGRAEIAAEWVWSAYVKRAGGDGTEEATMGAMSEDEILALVRATTAKLGRRPKYEDLAKEAGVSTPNAMRQRCRDLLVARKLRTVRGSAGGVFIPGEDPGGMPSAPVERAPSPRAHAPSAKSAAIVRVRAHATGGLEVLIEKRAELAARIERIDAVIGFMRDGVTP